jgi:hypothetical protein
MKIIVSFFLLQFLCLSIYGQGKEDYTWILGYPPNDPIVHTGGTILNFKAAEIEKNTFHISVQMSNGTQISDDKGDLLFYSNGCKILNGKHKLIESGENINPGALHDEWCDSTNINSYSTAQGLLSLPWPGRPDEYAMFHLGWFRLDHSPGTYYLRDFYYTQIDMEANGGLGKVVDKNHLMLQDDMLVDNLTAVRHGNGRDWWIVQPRGFSDSIYMYLLTPYGIEGPRVERTGLRLNWRGFNAGQVAFSPDGTKYVRANYIDGVDILDFDRCKGKFCCTKRLPYPGSPDDQATGVAVSPSSRYLYVSALTKLFQYDLWAKDVESSKIQIGVYDNFIDSTGFLPTSFYQQMLAPNGKIYMTSTNGVIYLHTIHQPDSAGLACDFRQHDFKLPTLHGFCVPNFPHFRLYDLPGSPCDSLGIDAPEQYRVIWSPSDAIRLYPNPVVDGGYTTVTFPPCAGGRLRVYTAAGKYMGAYEIDRDRYFDLDCSAFPAGVYICSFLPNGAKKPLSAKLVVVR